ncbi:Transposable element Tcb1 transposase [Araneus ventricosus]|uniref:Transposable element Tcb1 transposase n=1 Tax=Araneus ventricosus TaxID=182803 RepID=A0A4Y2I998_ARAVE|nr:Transposable element Tcb1 transposase [Araneus ventricosus]
MEASIKSSGKDLISGLCVKASDTAAKEQIPICMDKKFFTCDVCSKEFSQKMWDSSRTWEQFNITESRVSKFLKRWVDQGGVPKVPKSARPRSTSRLIDRNILRPSRVNPLLTAVDIPRELCDPPKPSVRTIRCRLQAAGLNGRRPVKKPMISTKNLKARVEWAKAHKDWTKKEWEDVL